MRVGLTALTMAEYFRDVNEQDVLLFIDNIFRFVQAGSEISALLGRMPFVVNYQSTLSIEIRFFTRKNHLYQRRVHNFYSSSLCTRRRFNRSCPCYDICTFRCYYCTIKRISGQRYLSSSRSFRFNLNYAPTSNRW